MLISLIHGFSIKAHITRGNEMRLVKWEMKHVQPIHWNYNLEKLDALLKSQDNWEFWESSQNPFYNQQTGKQTCYGDQAYVVLKSLVENSGVNIPNLQKSFYQFFGPSSAYENPIWSGGEKKLPIAGPWRNGSLRDFIKNYEEKKVEAGSESDQQMDCILRIVPVTALYAGHPDMLTKVEEIIRLTQNNDESVTFGMMAARLLEIYILNGQTPDAMDKVIKELNDPKRKSPNDLDNAMVSLIRQVLRVKDDPHVDVACNVFKNN